MDFTERLIKVLDYHKIRKASDFSKICGFNHQTALNYMNGSSFPTYDKMLSIKNNFEKINLNWLVAGESSMLLGSPKSYSTEEDNALNIAAEPGKDYLETRIKDLEKENKMLKGVITKFLGDDNGHNGKSAIG